MSYDIEDDEMPEDDEADRQQPDLWTEPAPGTYVIGSTYGERR